MTQLQNMDWDHVRIFLATLRAKSLRQAAEQLGLSHPTARRHLNAFEERLGLRLFDRRSDGLHATVEASQLQVAAEEVERAMQALGRVALAADPELRGPIRVTLPDILGTDLLMGDFMDFMRKWPEIDLQVDADYTVADLDRREADVAIRIIQKGKLPAEHLAGRKAAKIYKAVYGGGEFWIGWLGGELDRPWISETPFPELPIRGVMNNPDLQRAACAGGKGLTLLPCFFADRTLVRRTEPVHGFDVWVLVHPDLRDNPRLRVFRDFVFEALRRHRPALEGRDKGRTPLPSGR